MKIQVIRYSKWSFVVTTDVENQLLALHGKFITKPKPEHVDKPCWVFSKKRKADVEKIANEIGATVQPYNEGVSIALIADMKHVKILLKRGHHLNHFLKQKNSEDRFAGWTIKAGEKPEETQKELQSMLS